MILKDFYISVNAVDLSAEARAATMDEGAEQQDATTMGDTFRWFEAGLQTGELTVQFKQGFSSGGVDETLSALLADTDGFTVEVRPTTAAASGTNPKWTATCNLAGYQRFSGEVGEELFCTAEFALAAGTGWVRAEA